MKRRHRRNRNELYSNPLYLDLLSRVAANVVQLRERGGWTQEEAAHRCDGMNIHLQQRVEGAEANLTAITLARLCIGFEVDIAHLMQPAAPLGLST